MGNDNRSSRKVKDDESINSKKKIVNGKGSPASVSGATDTSGLRRSARETSSRKQTTSSPSNTRKSERIEKRTPTTTPIKKKDERTEKQMIASPLRRSDRGKKHTSLRSSGSKNSLKELASSDMKQKKEKGERNLKQCKVNASKVSTSERRDVKLGGRKRKVMDARTYKALFKSQRRRITEADGDENPETPDKSCQADTSSNRDADEELERPDNLPQADNKSDECSGSKSAQDKYVGGDECSGSKSAQDKDGEGDECSDSAGEELREECVQRASGGPLGTSCSSFNYLNVEEVDDHVEVEVSYPRQNLSFIEGCNDPSDVDGMKGSLNGGRVEETLDNTDKVLVDGSRTDLGVPEHVGFTSTGQSPDGESIENGSGDTLNSDKTSSSKRKIYAVDMDSNTCASSKDTSVSHTNGSSSSSSVCKRHKFDETCIACSKKRRIRHDLEKQQGLYSCDIARNIDLRGTLISKDRGKHEAAAVTELAEKCDSTTSRTERSSDDQMDGNKNTCIICKLGGMLRCCDGIVCKRSYHLSCLDPPLDNDPPAVWHCPFCVEKIRLGVHSMSGVVESIWETREVEVSDAEGLRKQKQYFVKYSGLAHVHNEWVAETQLQLEAPMLVTKFNKQNLIMKWNEEWTVPHRLLKKRLLLSLKPRNDHHSEHAGKDLNFHYEWLVKWCGLDYEYATWELENASFLSSPEGQNLISEYQDRHEKAKTATSPVDKTDESLVKLPKLRTGCPHVMDNIHLSYVKKLHEFWNKGQSIIVFDDQERVMRVTLFIFSLKRVYRPFLIITSSDFISLWETEFSRLAQSVDVKVCNEGREARRSIRILDFYGEDGRVVFQVLLSPVDAFVKELNILRMIRWEAVIVDDCQSSKVSTQFEQMKTLPTDIKILLFRGPVGESVAEYLNLLSLLSCDGPLANSMASRTESVDNLGKLKETLSRFIAYDCKSDSSKFIEYWVPVQISNVQLEQYCATLLSNSIALCSCSKNDPVGALRDVLISIRKCCDHPYIVDPSLQGLLTKELELFEYLDVGIKASGKLQVLDSILSEMKNQQLRVLILFQAISGYGRDSITIGDILDDFVRQRFGQDSYERVDGGAIVQSKKQAALNNFNKKDMGRFVFLLENRACLPSIKLSSVDSIVIFDSDWNPANDLRALQKITIDSQSDQIKIFRLYTSCTVEEKILILGEQNLTHLTLDSKLQTLSRSLSDALLMWGASYLFNKLDEFHSASISNLSSQKSFSNNLMKEFLDIISQKRKSKETNNLVITRALQSWGTYTTNLPLLGELKLQLPNGEQPHIFWRKLLDGRNPQWKHLHVSTPRQRKRVQYIEESRKTNAGHDDVGKKRKKTVNNCIDPAALRPVLEEGEIEPENEGANGFPAHYGSQVFPDESFRSGPVHIKTPLPDPQKSLHRLLKPDVSKLCKILKLSENVKIMVERFLEYVIENHRVNREPATILQAFLISLCWIGASLLKHKIDKKESLALAKKQLNFSCKEEEANSVYLKLEPLKEMFLTRPENLKKLDALKDSISTPEATSQKPLDARVTDSVPVVPQVKVEIEDTPENQYAADEHILLEQGQSANHNTAPKETSKSLKDVQSTSRSKWMEKLAEMIQKQMEEFNREWDKKRVDLENEYKVNKAFIRTLHNNLSVRLEKLKILEKEFAKKMEEHKQQRDINLKDLKTRQLTTETTAAYLSVATDLPASEGRAQNELPLHGSQNENQVVSSEASEHGPHDGPENAPPLSRDLIEVESPDKLVNSMHPTEVVPDTHVTLPNEMVGGSIPTETASVLVTPSSGKDEAEALASEKVSAVRIEKPNNFLSTTHHSLEKQIPDATLSSVPTEEFPEKGRETAPNDVAGCVDSVEMENPTAHCSKENDRGDAIGPDTSHAVENQNEGTTHSSGSSNSPSAGVSQEKVPSVQTVISPASDHSLPTDLEFQNARPLACSEMQDEDLQGNSSSLAQVEIEPLQPVDAGQNDLFTSENPSVEPLEEPCSPLSTNPALVENQSNLPPASGLVLEPPGEEQTLPCDSDAWAPPHSDEEPSNRSDRAMLQTGGDQPDLYSTGNQSSGELHISSQNAEVPPRVAIAAEISNQAGLHPRASLSILQGSDNHNQVASRMPSHPSHAADPLQSELERLREEKENVIKFHEDVKLRLKSECEKELAEIIAQIKGKYEAKRQDAEAAFLVKKNELDTNLSKVLMNKILAEAFRSKCLDLIPSGTTGMQHVMPASFMQQMHQLSSQYATRPSPVAASTSAGQSSASQQVPTPPQIVHQPAALFSSTPPTRPLNINPITPTGNLRSSGEIRGPAPHIQPFRPSSSVSSFQRMMSSQHAQSNLPSTSPSLPQASTRPPFPLQQPVPSLATNHSALRNQQAPSSLPVTSLSLPQASCRPSLPSTSSLPATSPSLPQASSRPSFTQNAPSSGSLPATSLSLPQATSRPPSPPPLPTNHFSQNRPSSLPATSLSLPQASSQPPTSSQPLISTTRPSLPPLPQFSTSHTGLYSIPPWPETAGVSSPTPNTLNLRLSNMELLINIDNRVGGQQPNIMLPPPDLPSNFEALDLSGFGAEGTARVSSSTLPVETDFVCLSDDD